MLVAGDYDLRRHRAHVCGDIQPCAAGRPASFDEADGDLRVCYGQHPGSARHLYAPIPGTYTSRCGAPGRQCGTVDHHDPYPCLLAETGGCCAGMEAGLATGQENCVDFHTIFQGHIRRAHIIIAILALLCRTLNSIITSASCTCYLPF